MFLPVEQEKNKVNWTILTLTIESVPYLFEIISPQAGRYCPLGRHRGLQGERGNEKTFSEERKIKEQNSEK